MTVEDRLRQFLTTQFLFEFDGAVTPDANLFDLGLIDSFGFVELVTFIECEFDIMFSVEELVGSPLNSLTNMAAAIQRKTDA